MRIFVLKIQNLVNLFLNINNTYINATYIFNILLSKYKEKYAYNCGLRKNSLEDLLCTNIKYNIES